MSTALAIASVTYVLKDLLTNGLSKQNHVNGSIVTALPPDRIDTENEPDQLNLFMYQAKPNQGWRNEGYPSRSSQGEQLNNPPLALDLHYFLTAYGAEELNAEILLGYGMQVFHEIPVLTRNAIRASLASPPASLNLSSSKLDEQVEQIKITPEPLNAEEMSKLWTAFQAKYRTTAAYQVTVVLIQSHKSTKAALPVLDRRIYALPFHQPTIDAVQSQAPAANSPISDHQKILANYKLVLVGKQLKSDHVKVRIDGQTLLPNASDISDTRIVVALPNTAANDLSAGIHGVQVIHELEMGIGSPPVLHRGVESNVEAFVLSPELVAPLPAYAEDTKRITINVQPAITDRQRAVILLNSLNPASGKAYSFEVPGVPPGQKKTKHVVQTKGIASGTYLIRIQVDGAESPLTASAGTYNAPTVSIP